MLHNLGTCLKIDPVNLGRSQSLMLRRVILPHEKNKNKRMYSISCSHVLGDHLKLKSGDIPFFKILPPSPFHTQPKNTHLLPHWCDNFQTKVLYFSVAQKEENKWIEIVRTKYLRYHAHDFAHTTTIPHDRPILPLRALDFEKHLPRFLQLQESLEALQQRSVGFGNELWHVIPEIESGTDIQYIIITVSEVGSTPPTAAQLSTRSPPWR